MDLHCENCGQTVLPTDTVCWRCGWLLPEAATDQPATADAARPLAVTAVTVYASLTLLTILLLCGVLRALGGYPVALLDPQAPIKPGWRLVTDRLQTFTLELPPGWNWAEDNLADQLTAELQLAALTPWAEAVDDLDVWLVALPGEAAVEGVPGFVVVAHSRRLTRLTPEQMVAFWTDRVEPENLLATAVLPDLRGQPKATAVLVVQAAGGPWNCRQESVSGSDGRFLVAGCLPADAYEAYAREYEILLASFQLLLPPA